MSLADGEVIYWFEGFALDLARGALLTAGSQEVPLRRKSFELLRLFVTNAGRLLDRDTLNRTIWSDVAVTDDGVTQCVRDIRRALGDDSQRIIRTVPRRGYVFAASVTAAPRQHAGQSEVATVSQPAPSLVNAPRLSLVVLPFHNRSGDQEQEYLADGITDDLTTDLSQLPGALVIARSSAYAYKGKAVDVRRVGQDLGVRYVLEGSVRKLSNRLRVNAQLSSTETGTQLWSDRFDQSSRDLSEMQDEIVARLRSVLNIKLIDFEGLRSARERADSADAHDLVLRARSLQHPPRTHERNRTIIRLYEQALELDPSSIGALTGLARALLAWGTLLGHDVTPDVLERASALLSQAAEIDGDHSCVLLTSGHLLRLQQRWIESIPILQRLIDLYPGEAEGYARLAFSKMRAGDADEAIPLLERSLRLDPCNPLRYNNYANLGYAMLLVGRYQECIEWNQRALLANPAAPGWMRSWYWNQMASAHAWSGQSDEARRALAEARHLEPHDSVRSHFPDVLDPRHLAQIERYREGLRLAGLRDHAEEVADFGVAADCQLHAKLRGFTPLTVPGATTIQTGELVSFVPERQPVVIDTVSNFWGQSIPYAIGLRGSGVGGGFDDSVQTRLGCKLQALTGDNRATPIVTVGWNSERFDGYNLSCALWLLGTAMSVGIVEAERPGRWRACQRQIYHRNRGSLGGNRRVGIVTLIQVRGRGAPHGCDARIISWPGICLSPPVVECINPDRAVGAWPFGVGADGGGHKRMHELRETPGLALKF
jgi:TolB-like protein/Flp pilus assembly protein TadD